MKRFVRLSLAAVCVLTFAVDCLAGPFVHTSVAADDPAIVAWAAAANLIPGPHDGSANGAAAIGPADGLIASLGEVAASEAGTIAAGEITLDFNNSLFDGGGDDFVVFENAFEFGDNPGFWYAELAFVEVSTNGVDFARFPATSLNTEGAGDPATDLITPFGRAFAGVDISNINGLAGFDGPATFGGAPRGTPFDLTDLAATTAVTSGAVDLDEINFVKLIDILGNGSVLDDAANPIFDAFDDAEPPTGVNGFDLDAIGAIHIVPEPATLGLAGLAAAVAVLCRRHRQRVAS